MPRMHLFIGKQLFINLFTLDTGIVGFEVGLEITRTGQVDGEEGVRHRDGALASARAQAVGDG